MVLYSFGASFISFWSLLYFALPFVSRTRCLYCILLNIINMVYILIEALGWMPLDMAVVGLMCHIP